MESFECPSCMVGRCRLQKQTFVCLYQKSIFCAPNTEIYICDMCDYQELPHRVLSLYDTLLKPSADVTPDIAPLGHIQSDKKINFKKSSRL
ncbi:MAG TPA: hypothetical protein PLZ51_09715 [Aggregatilineales bacterium]|nr:hypothetical protein [Aggregatilineales bacterium]